MIQSKFASGLRHKSMRRQSRVPISVKKPHDVIPDLASDTIRVIPLGGVEEIGKNMMLVEYGEDIIIVDAGVQFTDDDTPGIDYILPNVKYLEERKHKIRALV